MKLDDLVLALNVLCALGCGLIAGVFFAFSSFVMGALARLEPPQGIAAMQSINLTVVNPLFMTVFLGTAVACLVLAGAASSRRRRPGAAYLLAGCLLYVVGAVAVTVVCNVPLNDALASVDPHGAQGASLWAGYLSRWMAWNHLRGAAALAAAGALTVALRKTAPRA